jgi:hypothetical protein
MYGGRELLRNRPRSDYSFVHPDAGSFLWTLNSRIVSGLAAEGVDDQNCEPNGLKQATTAPAAGSPGARLTGALLPGRYAVVAIPVAGGASPPTDREALAKLRTSATIVSLAAGQTVTMQLQVKQ